MRQLVGGLVLLVGLVLLAGCGNGDKGRSTGKDGTPSVGDAGKDKAGKPLPPDKGTIPPPLPPPPPPPK